MQAFTPLDAPLDGRVLVEASAGTGKTYAITTMVVRLLLEARLALDQILVVTFTEAATAELRDRVRGRLRQAVAVFGGADSDPDLLQMRANSDDVDGDRELLALAVRGIDEAAIHTIHGFCRRLLQENAFASGVRFDAELVADQRVLRDEVVADYFVDRLHDAPAELLDWLADAKVDQDRGRRVVDCAVQRPEADLVPARTEPVSPARDGYTAAIERARASWNEGEISRRLEELTLDKRSYPPAKIPEWCAAMSEYLRAPADPPQLPSHLAKLGWQQIETRGTKNSKLVSHEFFLAVDQIAAACRSFEADCAGHATEFLRGLAEYARREVPRRKDEAGVLAFDDLLQKVAAALQPGAGTQLAELVRRSHPAALIDEFQDTDPVQYEIFRRIYGDRGRLFLVGDPKQAIYSFRGADVFAYLAAVRETAPDRQFTMDENWRSDPRLVRAVGALFGRRSRPFLLEQIEFPPVGAEPRATDKLRAADGAALPPLEVLHVPKECVRGDTISLIAGLTATEIVALLRSGTTIDGEAVVPERIAVLTRTNRQAFAVQSALRAVNVPSVVLGDKTVFQSFEAQELQRVLAAVAEPTNRNAQRAALLTDLLGVGAAELIGLESDEAAWETWAASFREWHTLWSERGFVQMLQSLLRQRSVQERLLSFADGERRMTNLLHLLELLHTAATRLHLGPTGVLHWLAERRSDDAYAPESEQIRLESDEHALSITTIHKSKGLEYDVVYCPYLCGGASGRALLVHDGGEVQLVVETDAGEREKYEAKAKWEDLAESLRLLYVAVTRARHRCTLVWGQLGKQFKTSALGYLLHGCSEISKISELERVLHQIDDAAITRDLETLAAASAGCISWRSADPAVIHASWQRKAEAVVALDCRTPHHRVDRAWRTASFSQLAAGAPTSALDFDDGREHDQLSLAVADAGHGSGAKVALASFPRGARAGNFFHDLFEHLDFTASPDGIRELVVAKLADHGYAAHDLARTVERGVTDILATPLLAGAPLTLGQLTTSQRLNELEFLLPVAPRARRTLTPGRLAAVFREHATAELPASYAGEIEQLPFSPIWGFLRGFIDLVLEYDGRYYVVDYKTTYLGDVLEAYAPERVMTAMAHGHYFLQAQIYAVAVHRFLAQRLADYDYDRHFGGVIYTFVRGMTPASGPTRGVYSERPPAARIEALSRLLGDTAGVQA